MLLRAVDGLRGTVVDLDTGKRVPKVIELNLERGYVKAYYVIQQDDNHPEREVIRRDELGRPEWYEAAGRFKLLPPPPSIRTPAPGSPKVVLGADYCGICRSPLTLPGDDLCPRCRAKERGQRNRFVVERLNTPFLDRKCANCTRLAVWSVADEVAVSPEQSKGSRYYWERGMTVGRRYYCDSCYRPARLLDPRGEVIEDLGYAGPDVAPAWMLDSKSPDLEKIVRQGRVVGGGPGIGEKATLEIA